MYDLDTPEGMESAVVWLHNLLSFGQNIFTWGVPRSSVIYHINKIDQTARRSTPDEGIDRVFREMGWKVEDLK